MPLTMIQGLGQRCNLCSLLAFTGVGHDVVVVERRWDCIQVLVVLVLKQGWDADDGIVIAICTSK